MRLKVCNDWEGAKLGSCAAWRGDQVSAVDCFRVIYGTAVQRFVEWTAQQSYQYDLTSTRIAFLRCLVRCRKCSRPRRCSTSSGVRTGLNSTALNFLIHPSNSFSSASSSLKDVFKPDMAEVPSVLVISEKCMSSRVCPRSSLL